MAKRFTATGKWNDTWFFYLTPEFKLAWVWMLDNCSRAGLLELIPEMANQQIGCDVDWDEFIKRAGDRVHRLKSGKLWVKPFVTYQFPRGLSETSNYTKPVIEELKANGLWGAYLESISPQNQANPRVAPTLLDKDKDKDKDDSQTPGQPPTSSQENPENDSRPESPTENPPETHTAQSSPHETFEAAWDRHPERQGEKKGRRAAERAYNELDPSEVSPFHQAHRRYARVKRDGWARDLANFIREDWRDWYAEAEKARGQAERSRRKRARMAASHRRDREQHKADLPEMLAQSWRELASELAHVA